MSNFKWKINYSPCENQTDTRLTSSFFEGEINPISHSVINLNSLKIIGKTIDIKYKFNGYETKSLCVIFDEINIPQQVEIKQTQQVNHSIRTLIFAIMIFLVILLFLLVAFLRKKKHSRNDGFRVVDLSTSVGNNQVF